MKNIVIKIMVVVISIPFIIYWVLMYPYYFLRKALNQRLKVKG